MTNISERVTNCFLNVFPDIQEAEVPQASAESLAAWDSVAHITLLSAVAEEFNLDLAPEDFEQLTSYTSIVDYVSRQ